MNWTRSPQSTISVGYGSNQAEFPLSMVNKMVWAEAYLRIAELRRYGSIIAWVSGSSHQIKGVWSVGWDSFWLGGDGIFLTSYQILGAWAMISSLEVDEAWGLTKNQIRGGLSSENFSYPVLDFWELDVSRPMMGVSGSSHQIKASHPIISNPVGGMRREMRVFRWDERIVPWFWAEGRRENFPVMWCERYRQKFLVIWYTR